MLILDLEKGVISPSKLSQCQQDALDGRYVIAMSGFVQWIAGRHDEVLSEFKRRVAALRSKALQNSAHARTPEIVANLQGGLEMYLEFAEEKGAICRHEHQEWTEVCWEALSEAAAAQGKHQAATEPTVRYISTLRALLTSGHAHFAARDGGPPKRSPDACGWRFAQSDIWLPHGACIGWIDDADLFIEPTAAYRMVQVALRDAGEVLAISEQTLSKRLKEKGLLASVDTARQTLTIRRSIGGSTKNVLHFSRATILPDVSEGDE